jgi:hypothetical protein
MLRPVHVFLAGICLMVLAVAQSRITADQLRAGAASNLRILAVDSTTGRFAYLTLGGGVEIVGTTLQATAAAPRSPAPLSRNTDGSYSYGGGAVFRNGLFQTPGVDYTIASGAVRPVSAWAVDDVVTGY